MGDDELEPEMWLYYNRPIQDGEWEKLASASQTASQLTCPQCNYNCGLYMTIDFTGIRVTASGHESGHEPISYQIKSLEDFANFFTSKKESDNK